MYLNLIATSKFYATDTWHKFSKIKKNNKIWIETYFLSLGDTA